MRRSLKFPLAVIGVALAGGFALSCERTTPVAPGSEEQAVKPATDHIPTDQRAADFSVCADGAAASFTFQEWDYNGVLVNQSAAPIAVAANSCVLFTTHAGASAEFHKVTVTEASHAAGFTLDYIQRDSVIDVETYPGSGVLRVVTNNVTGTTSVTGLLDGDVGVVATYHYVSAAGDINAYKTAVGKWLRETKYDWTLQKSVTPASASIADGGSATFNYTLVATRTGTTTDKYLVEGKVCFVNTGSVALEGLAVTDKVQALVGDVWTTIATATLDASAPQIFNDPNCYPYSVEFTPVQGAFAYRNVGVIHFTNYWNSPDGIMDVEAIQQFAIPDLPTLTEIDEAASLTDALTCPTGFTCTPSSGSWSLTDTQTLNYSVVITEVNGQCGSTVDAPNTATLTETDTNTPHTSSATVSLTLPSCVTPCPAGSFTFTYNAAGDLLIKYDQFPAPNDNSYGVNAVGWPNGHKFTNLTGSDHAGIELVDPNGTVKLSFLVDYLHAVASAPSGYASLGVTGGDGKMLVGTATGITATTSLANNLNNINIPGLFNAAHVQQFGSVNVLIDSPPTDAAHQTYNISDPSLAGWDFHNTYYVTVSAAKLASLGFDPATWVVRPNPAVLHNSPAKPCPATPGVCSLAVTKKEVKDKQVKVTINNTSTSPVVLTELLLNWPSATNGKLMQVKLDGDVVYDNPDIVGGYALLTTAELVADQKKRTIDKGSSDVLGLIFEFNADKLYADYLGSVKFGNCLLNILP